MNTVSMCIFMTKCNWYYINNYVYSPISNTYQGPPKNINNLCLASVCAGEWCSIGLAILLRSRTLLIKA